MFDYDLGVIGGGAAGLTITAGAARLGARVLLVDRAHRLGGDCLHTGCVPSKTLLHIARVYHQTRQLERLGLPAVEPGPVDFARISGKIREVIASIEPHDSPDRFCSLGAMVRQGQARFVDRHRVDIDGSTVTARHWAVCTGSQPFIPDIPGLSDVAYLTNENIFSMSELPRELIILGGGPIALEMAQAFCRLGSRVTILQRSGQLLSREDADMAGLVADRLMQEGVRLELSCRVESVARTADGVRVLMLRDGQRTALSGSHLLVALGRRANCTNLGLENAGVTPDSAGLAVDARMRTACPSIFAAGDVTGRYQFTHAAGYEAGVVIANTVFRLPRKADYTWMPWCTYTDPELASVGLNEKRALERGVRYRVWEESFADNDRALTEESGCGKLKMLVDEGDRPLGVQICGPGAGELLGVWSTFFAAGMSLSRLAGAVMPYPTLGEISKRVAGAVVGEKLFSERVRRGLALIFQLKGRGDEDGCGLRGRL